MKNSNRIWLLMGKKLSGSITPEEVFEFELLLEQDPEVWYSYELLNAILSKDEVPADFMRQLNSLLNGDPDPEAFNKLLTGAVVEREEASVSSKRSPFLVLSLSVLFLIMSAFAFIYWHRAENRVELSQQMNEIVAPNGSKTKILLADGTEIWLNAGSKLLYPKNFSMENREVYLNGEAYFKVVHSDQHSFIVHTRDADIVDLGTTFNVKAYEGSSSTETTLIEGAIEVVLKKNPSQKILVAPNEKFILRRTDSLGNVDMKAAAAPVFEVSKIVPYSVTNDIIETAWVNDKLIFRNESFEELSRAMERRYNVKINIDSQRIREYQLTGIFKNESIEEALQVLRVIAPFNYTINNNEIRITE